MELKERLRTLHVWPQFVADHYADILSPKQIENLYAVGQISHEAADRIEALEGALRNCIAELESMAHSEFDGVWSDEDFDELTGRFQAILSNKGDSDDAALKARGIE